MTMENLAARKITNQSFLREVIKNHVKTYIWKVMYLKQIVRMITVNGNIRV